MNALQLFNKHAPNKTFLAVILGSMSGLFYAMLIPIVIRALSDENDSIAVFDEVIQFMGFDVAHSHFALLFVFLCVLIMIFNSLSEIILSNVALEIRFSIRKDLYNRIKQTPISALDQVGQSRLIQALSTDVTTIIMGAQLFPGIVTNAVTLLGMLGYLAFINYEIFLYIVQVMVLGVATYQIPILIGTKYFGQAREHQDDLQEGFKGLIGGAKELKLSIDKQAVYENEVLHKHERIIRDNERKGLIAYNLAGNYGSLLSFFAIGGLSFIFINYYMIANAEIIAAVMILLYISGPIAFLINVVPQVFRTKISLRKMEALYKDLPEEDITQKTTEIKPWQTITLAGITFKYLKKTPKKVIRRGVLGKIKKVKPEEEPVKHVKPFGIGPIDLTINKGDITFITGGNGSGKSTLCKVISQHLLPSDGKIFYDEEPITRDNILSFRQDISCIYSDYYLFERILDVQAADKNITDEIHQYLQAFQIAEKVSFENGRFSTLQLSDGQRRRLALVVSLVEDKSLYVFDEWAADQDPQFKQVFYRQILPELKQKNKAIVVISHDDRYFDLADKIVVMENGLLR